MYTKYIYKINLHVKGFFFKKFHFNGTQRVIRRVKIKKKKNQNQNLLKFVIMTRKHPYKKSNDCEAFCFIAKR